MNCACSTVLTLALCSQGETIVTGAGDETIRFWNAFPKTSTQKKGDSSVLNHTISLR